MDASPLRQLPLHVPQLVLHGAGDAALPPEIARRYAEAATRSGDTVTYIELPGAGQMDHLDVRSDAHRALKAWLLETLCSEVPEGRGATS